MAKLSILGLSIVLLSTAVYASNHTDTNNLTLFNQNGSDFSKPDHGFQAVVVTTQVTEPLNPEETSGGLSQANTSSQVVYNNNNVSETETTTAEMNSSYPLEVFATTSALPQRNQTSTDNENYLQINTTDQTSNFTSESEGIPANVTTISSEKKDFSCPPMYYACDDEKTCVPVSFVCNYIPDCPDGSDELVSVCETKQQELVLCRNGQVKKGHDLICNNVTDCLDGSDEKDCHLTSMLKCNNGTQLSCLDEDNTCIENNQRCDGIPHCPNELEETPPFCAFQPPVQIKTLFSFFEEVFVNPGADCDFQCEDSGKCISAEQLCDDEIDCEDGSDENQCKFQTKNNGNSQTQQTDCDFWCADQDTCIPASYRCDGDSDCSDGSDENNCDDDDEMSYDHESHREDYPMESYSTYVIGFVIAGISFALIMGMLFICFRNKSRKGKIPIGKKAELSKIQIISNDNFTPPPSYSEAVRN